MQPGGKASASAHSPSISDLHAGEHEGRGGGGGDVGPEAPTAALPFCLPGRHGQAQAHTLLPFPSAAASSAPLHRSIIAQLLARPGHLPCTLQGIACATSCLRLSHASDSLEHFVSPPRQTHPAPRPTCRWQTARPRSASWTPRRAAPPLLGPGPPRCARCLGRTR